VDAIVARYGPFLLYGYTVWLGLGLIAALALTARLNTAANAGWFDGALAAAAGALIGGRVAFVWLQGEYFSAHPAEAWQIGRGGLAYHGALAGALAGLWLWARLSHRPFWASAGLFGPGLALLAAFGWLACGVDGCAYGRVIPIGSVALVDLVAAELPDDLGIITLRYRTQMAGALLSLLALGLALVAVRRRWPPAAVFFTALGSISLARALVAPFRGDAVPGLWGVRADLLVDVGLVLLCCLAAVVVVMREKRARKPVV
jgi:phosphatidylglycerol:prolipoprotein diacylglycerol transferase